ncbi:MAG: S9 family peptidase [Dehalococcoidia bacterium]
MAKTRPFTPDDLYLIRQVSDPQVSPAGDTAAYVVSWFERDSDETQSAVWIVALRGKASAPRRFTQGTKDHSPRWSPDGRYLAFVSDRGEKNQVFVAPLEGGEARQVTSTLWGVSGAPAWSPDGASFSYAARTGDFTERKDRKGAEKNAPRVITDLRYKLDGIGFFDERRMHIFVCDVDTGAERQLTTGDYYDGEPAWSPDGKSIAFVSDRERSRHQRQFRSDAWIVPAKGGRPRRLTRARGAASGPTFSPDGKWLAFVGHEQGDEGGAKNVHLMVVPANDAAAPRSLSTSLDRPAAGWPALAGRAVNWTADSKSVMFLVSDRGTQVICQANLSARSKAHKILDGERQIEAFVLTPDGEHIVFTAVWPSSPWEMYRASIKNGRRETNLSHANDDLAGSVALANVRRLSYKAQDGLDIEAFLLYPSDYQRGERRPLAVNVHGGPHSFHPGARSLVEYQALTAKGYVVMLPNPRGSTGYGEAFSEACVRDWGGADFGDIMKGVDILVRRGVADPDRLFIGGYSYGGFMASWAVGHTDRFRAALVGAPVSNQVSAFGTGDIPLFDMHEIGGLPQRKAEEYALRSPITYLENCTTPVLLVHHEGDLRCPIAQSEEIFHALKVLGREVEFVRYPGGFHTYNTHAPSQIVDRISRTIRWYDEHGGRSRSASRKRVPIRKKVALVR